MRRIRSCVVCGAPCVGRVCRECYETRHNKGRYNSGMRKKYTYKEFLEYRNKIEGGE